MKRLPPQPSLRSRWGPRLLPLAGVVLVLAVSAWLRFQRLGEEAVFSSDEITYTGRAVTLREGGGIAAQDHPPLFWALTAALLPMTGDAVLSGRIVSAAAGVLGVLGTILLFRAAHGWPAAILAGAALGTLSFHVHWSRLAELDVLFLTFVVFAYVVWLRARRTGRAVDYLGAGLIAGAGACAKFPAGGALAVMGLHALICARSWRDVVNARHVALVAGFLIAIAPAVLVMAAAGQSGVTFHTTDRYERGDVDAHPFSIVESPARAARDLIKIVSGFGSTDSEALKLALSIAVVFVAGSVLVRAVPRLRRDGPLAIVVLHSAFYFAFFTLFPVKFDYYHLTEAALLVPAFPVVAIGLLQELPGAGLPRRAPTPPFAALGWGPRCWTLALLVAVAGLLMFNAVRSTAWPQDGPGVIAFQRVFRFLAADPDPSSARVAVDGGFFAILNDHRARGRLDPRAASMEILSQDVNLKKGGPERVARELREKGATALICSNKKPEQPGWTDLEALLRAESRPWRRVNDPLLPERLPLYLRGRPQ